MIEKHDFRKNETRIFFVRGLDRPSRVENAGKLSVSAQAVLVTFRLSVTRDDPSLVILLARLVDVLAIESKSAASVTHRRHFNSACGTRDNRRRALDAPRVT
jgi:hypothetical protein